MADIVITTSPYVLKDHYGTDILHMSAGDRLIAGGGLTTAQVIGGVEIPDGSPGCTIDKSIQLFCPSDFSGIGAGVVQVLDSNCHIACEIDCNGQDVQGVQVLNWTSGGGFGSGVTPDSTDISNLYVHDNVDPKIIAGTDYNGFNHGIYVQYSTNLKGTDIRFINIRGGAGIQMYTHCTNAVVSQIDIINCWEGLFTWSTTVHDNAVTKVYLGASSPNRGDHFSGEYPWSSGSGATANTFDYITTPTSGYGYQGASGGGSPPPASGDYVQQATGSNDASGTTITATFPANLTAGNLVAVAVSFGEPNLSATMTVTDNLGNTYTAVDSVVDTVNHASLRTFYAKNVAGGAATITATCSSAFTFRRIYAAEYSGLDTSAPLDVHHAQYVATGSSSTDGDTSGAATTTVNGDLIVGFIMDSTVLSPTYVAGTGYTDRATTLLNLEDKIQTTAGSVAATWTLPNTDSYVAGMMAFKVGAGGSSGSTTWTKEGTLTAGGTGTATSTAGALSAAVAVNDLIIVFAARGISSGVDDMASDTMTDSLGNTYHITGHGIDSGNSEGAALWYSVVTHAGTPTITTTYPATHGFRNLSAVCLRPTTGVPALDASGFTATAGFHGSGSGSMTSPSMTPTVDSDLIVGVFQNTSSGTATFTAGTGYTADTNTAISGSYCAIEHKTLGTGTSGVAQTAAGTDSAATSYNELIGGALFKVTITSPDQTVHVLDVDGTVSIGAVTITPGDVTENPAGLASEQAFGTVTVSFGPVTVNVGSVSSEAVVDAVTATPGAATINVAGINSEQDFGGVFLQEPAPNIAVIGGHHHHSH